MFCLRRAALRVLSSPSTSFAAKPRSITTLPSNSIFQRNHPLYVSPFQKRFASEEVAQAEPEADGATEAQHGKNSIASSTNAESSESITEERIQPASEEEHSAVASALSSAKNTLSNTASRAAETARGYATEAASAAGVGAATTEAMLGRTVGEDSSEGHTLYVGNLFFDVTEDVLKKEFEKFGTINSVRIVMDGRGLSKGFGYVEYDESSAATKAMEALNQQVFEGRRMLVQHTLKKERSSNRPGFGTRNSPTKTLFIGNMSFEMTDKDLNDLFREIKNVIDVRVAIDRRSGQPRGFAHADFVDVPSAEKAYKVLEGKEIYGRQLRIDYSLSSTQTKQGGSTRGMSERD